MGEELIVRKVLWNKWSKQLLATIPRGKGIEKGDYVVIKKLKVEK